MTYVSQTRYLIKRYVALARITIILVRRATLRLQVLPISYWLQEAAIDTSTLDTPPKAFTSNEQFRRVFRTGGGCSTHKVLFFVIVIIGTYFGKPYLDTKKPSHRVNHFTISLKFSYGHGSSERRTRKTTKVILFL